MKIVTGSTGTTHITSNDDQGLNQGIFGTGNTVLEVGNEFAATLTDATTVTLQSGEGVMQGVHFRIEPGTTDTVTISPGTTGYNRIDLICARYTKDAQTGYEDVSLVVIEGTPNSSAASAPAYNTGDILTGGTLVDFPLWQVTVTGLTPALTKLFSDPAPVAKVSVLNLGAYTSSGTRTIATFSPGIYIILLGGTVKQPDGSFTFEVLVKRGSTTIIESSGKGTELQYHMINGAAAISVSASTAISLVISQTGVTPTWDVTVTAVKLA